MSVIPLSRKLREHELELGRLNGEEDVRKKNNISLKFEIFNYKDQVEDDEFDCEHMNLLMKKFMIFMKNKSRGHPKRYINENQNIISNYNFYGYGEIGHVKGNYPNAKKSEVKKGRKFFKKKNWEKNDSISSSSSSDSDE